jgi:hypothetical protein
MSRKYQIGSIFCQNLEFTGAKYKHLQTGRQYTWIITDYKEICEDDLAFELDESGNPSDIQVPMGWIGNVMYKVVTLESYIKSNNGIPADMIGKMVKEDLLNVLNEVDHEESEKGTYKSKTKDQLIAVLYDKLTGAFEEQETIRLSDGMLDELAKQHGNDGAGAGGNMSPAMMRMLAEIFSGSLASVLTDKLNPITRPELNDLIDTKIEALSRVKIIKICDEVKNYEVELGKQHRDFDTILRLAQMRLDTFLVGPSGSGKTFVGDSVAKGLGLKFYFTSVGLQTTKSDLMGYLDAHGQYVPSHLRKAYENGGLFLLDEIDAGNPNVLTVINALLSNNVGSFPDQIIKRHEDFVFMCAGNTYGRGADRKYVGRNPIDGATLDRFVVFNFDYDENLEYDLAPNKDWCRKVQRIRAAVYKLGENVIVSTRAIIRGGVLLSNGFKDENALKDMLIYRGVSKDVKDKVEEQVK